MSNSVFLLVGVAMNYMTGTFSIDITRVITSRYENLVITIRFLFNFTQTNVIDKKTSCSSLLM